MLRHTNLVVNDLGRLSMSDRPCLIMIVDDDPAMRSLLADGLQDQGCQVVELPNGSEALSRIKAMAPDLIITDLKMPVGGFEYLQELRAAAPQCPIVLVTAFGDAQTKAKALECGVSIYLDKPVRISTLKAALNRICRIRPCRHQSSSEVQ